MRSTTTGVVLFAVLSFLCSAVPLQKRALTFRTYNDMSISEGIAGNAEAEAAAVWAEGLDLSDLTAISADDLAILKVERENAEDAETEAFNPAIDTASGAIADSLQCGKIKNKVLKLTGLAQIRQIELAKAKAAGEDTADIEAKLLDSKTKLANNIADDKAHAGEECRTVDFVGQTGV